MSRDRRKHLEMVVNTELNVTPLMDLTFLLLIVFMITAPMMEFGLDVSLPKLDARSVEAEGRTVVVSLTSGGMVYLDREPVSVVDLEDRLVSLASQGGTLTVLVRGDHRREYGEIVGVMRAVRRAGIQNVSLMTEAEN